jgi:hypothetical protein
MSLLPGQSGSLHRRHVRTFRCLRSPSGTTLRLLVGLAEVTLAVSELSRGGVGSTELSAMCKLLSSLLGGLLVLG